jgi:small subunit ribosomal protein S1
MATRDDGSGHPPGEDFASLLAEYEQKSATPKGRRGPQVGETVRGRIVSIGAEAVFVDLGGKSEGTLDIGEVRSDDGEVTVAVGDEIEAKVVSTEDGTPVLRRVIGHGRGAEARNELAQAFEHGIPVEGLVSGVNKGGLEVQVAGLRAFCPISQLELRHVEDAGAYVGQRLQFRITRFEPGPRGRDNVVLSRRALLEEEQRARAAETRARLQIGAVLRGTVSSLRDYGAFIDLGGIEGMLHVSEIGFARVAHPKDVLSVGQPVEVQVLRIEKSDDARRPEKISLSLKSLEKDPWDGAAERFPEGARLAGRVVRVEAFGAFVELQPGVEGLVHVSELGGANTKHLKHARQAVQVGDTVEVTVLGVDTARRRLSLSMAAAAPPSDEDQAHAAAAARAPAQTFGTLGDLLKGRKK